jgi:ppGpp synthetase/RelA/SpoT-type nucleotidyltranferase
VPTFGTKRHRAKRLGIFNHKGGVGKPNKKTKYTCEIQVRTLMEEVWGQVDHTLNYPHRTQHLGCREQLAALARATSSCTRLVDSIFRSYDDAEAIRLRLLRSRRLLRGK